MLQAAKRAAIRAERKLTAAISVSAAVEQKPAAPALSANGGGGGGTRVMIIGKDCQHSASFVAQQNDVLPCVCDQLFVNHTAQCSDQLT